MSSQRRYRVKDVARMTRVSIRTLHHYDAIGLLVPERTEAGYRLYRDDDLLRLQQILIGRELGLSLEQIRRSLDDPDFDRRKALEDQRGQLLERLDRTHAMIRAIDTALGAVDPSHGERTMDMKELFDGFDPTEYEEEAEARWGETDAYQESQRRARSYSKADWKRLEEEQSALYAKAAELMREGVLPDSEPAMDVAEAFRRSIDRWFYPCSYDMHRGLADLYEADPRFARNMDKHGEGLTAFLVAAIRANAARHGG